MKKLHSRILLIILLWTYFGLGMAHIHHASLTFDEGPHLAIGYATLRTGDFRLQPVHIHPPLANVIAAAPLLLQDDLPEPTDIGGWQINSLSAVTDEIVWQYPHPRIIATAGRTPIFLLSLVLFALIYRWSSDLFGRNAGFLPLFMLIFDPNIIAHSTLITTDLTVTLFTTATLYTCSRYLDLKQSPQNKTKYIIFTAVFAGLAQLSKVSALLLFPFIGFMTWGKRMMDTKDLKTALQSTIQTMLVIVAIAFVVLWAGYKFEVKEISGAPFDIPLGTHLEIYKSLTSHYQLGHPTFALGKISTHGWWWYFPVAFFLKTPIPILLLSLLSTGFGIISSIKYVSHHKSAHPVDIIMSTGWVVIYALSSTFSSVNIGYRHLLPILPFLSLLICHLISGVYKGKRPRKRLLSKKVLTGLLTAILLWLAMGTMRISPSMLEYFNEFAGGSKQGYRSLVDSNIDWGQNLWELKRWTDAVDVDLVYYAHYSPAALEPYNITAEFLPPDPRAVSFTPWHPDQGIYVIGATVLQGVYTPDINTYAYFRMQQPIKRLGGALFIYKVDRNPKPAWVVNCALTPTADEIKIALSSSDVRIIPNNCRATEIYPSGEAPGFYITAPDTPSPTYGELAFDLKTASGKTWRSIYQVDDQPAPKDYTEITVNLFGPLDFLGYTLDTTTLVPGGEIIFSTFWRVKSITNRPLSLIAHGIPSGRSEVLSGDGMGFPIEYWSIGDIFVQKHRLVIPDNVAQGEKLSLATGGYWLDTMERWQTDREDNLVMLSELTIQ